MLATLIQRYDNKNHFIFDPVQERETNGNFTGFQVPYFMIVLIFSIPFLDDKMSIFEKYGALIYLKTMFACLMV